MTLDRISPPILFVTPEWLKCVQIRNKKSNDGNELTFKFEYFSISRCSSSSSRLAVSIWSAVRFLSICNCFKITSKRLYSLTIPCSDVKSLLSSSAALDRPNVFKFTPFIVTCSMADVICTLINSISWTWKRKSTSPLPSIDSTQNYLLFVSACKFSLKLSMNLDMVSSRCLSSLYLA